MRQPSRPRVLLVNGNANAGVTAHLAGLARQAAPHLDIVPMTPASGPPYILTPADVAVAVPAVLETIDAHLRTADRAPDACLVACFGDVGIAALRQRFPFPVLSMVEASIFAALQLGERYGIVTLGEHWPAMLRELVERYGLAARCSGVYRIAGKPLELLVDREAARRAMQAVVETIPARSTDVLIMGGAALTGIARNVRGTVPFPIVDCLDASMAQLEAAIAYRRLVTAGDARSKAL